MNQKFIPPFADPEKGTVTIMRTNITFLEQSHNFVKSKTRREWLPNHFVLLVDAQRNIYAPCSTIPDSSKQNFVPLKESKTAKQTVKTEKKRKHHLAKHRPNRFECFTNENGDNAFDMEPDRNDGLSYDHGLQKQDEASHCFIKGHSKQGMEHDLGDMLSYDHGLQKDAETSCYPIKNPSEQGRNGDLSTIFEQGETDTLQNHDQYESSFVAVLPDANYNRSDESSCGQNLLEPTGIFPKAADSDVESGIDSEAGDETIGSR